LDWLCREPEALSVFDRTEVAKGELDALFVIPAHVVVTTENIASTQAIYTPLFE